MLAGIFVAGGLLKFSGYIIEKFIWILEFIVPSIRKKRIDSAKKFADDAKQTFSDAKQGFDSATKKTRSGFSDMFKNKTNNKQDINARLKELKKLLEDNVISKEEYEEQRKKIIGDV